jgi:hypothetical protein
MRFLSIVMALGLALSQSVGFSKTPSRILVKPSGSSPGSSDDYTVVVNSLAAALEAARKQPDEVRKGRVEIWLSGGRHEIRETTRLTVEDSPPGEGHLIIRSAEGERAVLSGSVSVQGWQKAEDLPRETPEGARGHILTAPWPEGARGGIYALFAGGERLPRARSKQVRIFGQPTSYQGPWDDHYQFSFRRGTFRNWSNLKDVELAITPLRQFQFNYLPLASIDENLKVVRTALRATGPLILPSELEESCWIENSLEFLDKPGRWVSDSKKRRLYFWPPDDIDPGKVRAAITTSLIEVEGKVQTNGEDTPVRGIEFRGLTFTETNRYPWDERSAGLQHDWELHDAPNAMLRFRAAQDCLVQDCAFLDGASSGVRLDLFARNIRIIGNEFKNLGGAAVVIAGYGPGTKNVSGGNEIAHNSIQFIGRDYLASPAIVLFQTAGNHVHHNLIHDIPYMAIVITGSWPNDFQRKDVRERSRTIRRDETMPTFLAARSELKKILAEGGSATDGYIQQKLMPFMHGRDNVVEYNDIFSFMMQLGDGNAIYVAGSGPGNIVRRNYIHDTLGGYSSYSIRTDDLQWGTDVVENVIANVSCGALTLKQVNRFDRNIVYNVRPNKKHVHSATIVQRGPVEGSSLSGNIFFYRHPAGDASPPLVHRDNPGDHGKSAALEDLSMDGNVYWTPDHPEQASEILAAMRKRGRDVNGRAGDPGFADPAAGDFRLPKGSPSATAGWTGLHTDETGPQGEWRKRFYGVPMQISIQPPSSYLAGSKDVDVVVSKSDPAVVVRYTTDLSQPEESSPVFKESVLRSPGTYRLRAFSPGKLDMHGTIVSVYDNSGVYRMQLGPNDIGTLPAPFIRASGDAEVTQDAEGNTVLELLRMREDGKNAPSLWVDRDFSIDHGLRIRTTFRLGADFAGKFRVTDRAVSTADHVLVLNLKPGFVAVPGSKTKMPLPAGHWIDAEFIVHSPGNTWDVTLRADDKILLEEKGLPPAPDGARVTKVNFIGWDMEAGKPTKLEVRRLEAEEAGSRPPASAKFSHGK